MSKPKKLTVENIIKQNNKIFTQKKVIIEARGQSYELLIDEHFSEDKVQELIIEMLQQSQDIINIEKILSLSGHTQLLMIKYFTNIGITTNDFKEQMKIFTELNKMGIISKILEHFNEKEMELINKYIDKARKNINNNMKNIENNKEIQDIIKETINMANSIENTEVFISNDKNSEEVDNNA